ncbi:MAG: hypothetical protein WCK26_01355 [Candidatus Saccharibacteria bacterium]
MRDQSPEESLPKVIEMYHPGDVLQLDSILELASIEDVIANNINPDMTKRQINDWTDRTNLKDLIRPSRFNGRISNICLEFMQNPYERLFDANERGLKFSKDLGIPRRRTSFFTNETVEQTSGFILTADASSSGRGVIGQIQTEVWYVPSPQQESDGEIKKKTYSNSGGSIHRYMARPEEEQNIFDNLYKTSRKIGLEVLRKGTINPDISEGITKRAIKRNII